MHNFNFLVELVLKKCIYPCNYSHKKDFVYFGYLQSFLMTHSNQFLHPNLRARQCLICFVSPQIKFLFSRDWFKCSHLVCILLFMVSFRGTKVQILIYIVAYISCLFLFLAEYYFSVWTFKKNWFIHSIGGMILVTYSFWLLQR